MSAALLQRLREEKVPAIVRGRDAKASIRTVETLWCNGIAMVEVSLSGTDALAVLREPFPQVPLLAVGGVTPELVHPYPAAETVLRQRIMTFRDALAGQVQA